MGSLDHPLTCLTHKNTIVNDRLHVKISLLRQILLTRSEQLLLVLLFVIMMNANIQPTHRIVDTFRAKCKS